MRLVGASLALALHLAACGTPVAATSGQAELGVPYPFELGHCGLRSPIDFDGSLWAVESGSLHGDVYQPLRGTITLSDDTVATFEPDGADYVVTLSRRNGPQIVEDCA